MFLGCSKGIAYRYINVNVKGNENIIKQGGLDKWLSISGHTYYIYGKVNMFGTFRVMASVR